MIYIAGSLFDVTGVDGYAHGVNCDGVMGSGIAVAFREKYPEMYESYRAKCLRGDLIPGECFTWKTDQENVYNLASQDRPGPNARIDWLASAVTRMFLDPTLPKTVATPRIGCGIGGLDWKDVELVLMELEEKFDATIVVATPK